MLERVNVRSMAALLSVLTKNGIISPSEAAVYCSDYLHNRTDIESVINDIYEHNIAEDDKAVIINYITDALMDIAAKGNGGETQYGNV